MNRNKKLLFISVLLALLIILNYLVVFAEGGKGGGGGQGGSGQNPLTFTGVSLVTGKDGGAVDNASGAVLEQLYKQNQLANKENIAGAGDIPLMPLFNFQFDKNVVDSAACWITNSQAFSMTSGNNEIIPITVSKIDDTVDTVYRQNIFIQPVSALKPGTQYQIKVSPNLVAKNGTATLGGTTNGQGIAISFKTKGVGSNATATTTGIVSAQNANKSANTSGTAINWIVVAGAILVVGWLLLEIIIRLRKKKKQ